MEGRDSWGIILVTLGGKIAEECLEDRILFFLGGI